MQYLNRQGVIFYFSLEELTKTLLTFLASSYLPNSKSYGYPNFSFPEKLQNGHISPETWNPPRTYRQGKILVDIGSWHLKVCFLKISGSYLPEWKSSGNFNSLPWFHLILPPAPQDCVKNLIPGGNPWNMTAGVKFFKKLLSRIYS